MVREVRLLFLVTDLLRLRLATTRNIAIKASAHDAKFVGAAMRKIDVSSEKHFSLLPLRRVF